MGKFGKILAVFGVLTIGVVIASKTTKKQKKNRYSSVIKTEDHDTDLKKEKPIDERLKAAAIKKVISILSWVADHEKEFKGAVLTFEIAGAAIGAIFALKKGFKADQVVKDLQYIKDQAYNDGWNECLSTVFMEMKGSIKDHSKFSITLNRRTTNFIVQEVAA